MTKRNQKLILFCLLLFFIFPAAAQTGVANINLLIASYPDLHISAHLDSSVDDYLLSFTHPETGTYHEFYWSKGSMLPAEELGNADTWWSILYEYDNVLKDPADMTEEERLALMAFSSRQNRKTEAGTPMFFFDAVYSSTSEKQITPYIERITFLGRKTRVHKRIIEPLRRVEEKIQALMTTDASVKKFVDGLISCDAYHWRVIEGTNRKSFHSLGIAIDFVPQYYGGEAFWSWARDHNPDGWMLTPLRRRWMPPKPIIDAFESEGFIWGGYWAIWDNMHFEYHPELINALQ